jgi:hypothetical protein
MDKPFKYTEHMRTEIHGFDVTDATSEGTRPHNELVWVGFNTEGKWLTVEEATELANAILNTAIHNATRRKTT